MYVHMILTGSDAYLHTIFSLLLYALTRTTELPIISKIHTFVNAAVL